MAAALGPEPRLRLRLSGAEWEETQRRLLQAQILPQGPEVDFCMLDDSLLEDGTFSLTELSELLDC